MIRFPPREKRVPRLDLTLIAKSESVAGNRKVPENLALNFLSLIDYQLEQLVLLILQI